MSMLVVVRVRGSMGVRSNVAQTLRQLKLSRVNHAVLLEENEHNNHVLIVVKDIVTWGKATDEVVAALKAKGNAPYKLHPPVKGYRQIKLPFPKGALGNRGEKINELVKRML